MSQPPSHPPLLDAETRKQIARWNRLYGEKRSGTQDHPVSPVAEKTAPTVYLNVFNDDFANHFGHPKFFDGGIRSSQIQLGGSLHHRGIDWMGEVSHTVFTGWGSNNSYIGKQWLDNRAVLDTNPLVNDGLQALGGERFGLSLAGEKIVRHYLTTQGDGTFSIGLRTDLAHASGNKPIQEWFHEKIAHTGYLRSELNKVATTSLANVETTGTYRWDSHGPGMHRSFAAFGGAALGNGYHGAMLGGEISLGSHQANRLTVTDYSAQYGNTNLQHAAPGHAKSGSWRMSAYLQGFLSGTRDYRSNATAGDPYLFTATQQTLPIIGQKFGTQYLGDAITYPDGVRTVTPQYNVVDYTVGSVRTNFPSLLHYSFNPLNAEAGIKGEVQAGRVQVGLKVNAMTNPIKTHYNKNYAEEFNAETHRLLLYSLPGPTLGRLGNDGSLREYISNSHSINGDQFMALPQLSEAAAQVKPYTAPKITLGGEISVAVTLGARPKKEHGR